MTKKRKLCLSHFKSVFFKWQKLFPKVRVSGETKDSVDWNKSLRGWIPSLTCSYSSPYRLLFEVSQIFPVSFLYSQTQSVVGLNLSVSNLFPQPSGMCMPTFCIADFISIFSMWETLSWLQIYYLCLPGVFPNSAYVSQLPSTLFHPVSSPSVNIS